MIVLRATPELKDTFERLIEAVKAPVKWNGCFLAIDNYLVLQGEVRSLFFCFDDRKVGTNLFDIEIKEEEIRDITGNVYVLNVINMILYAFGKWGTLPGIRVEKNYEQLNRLFCNVMQEIDIEPEYNYQYFRFYKEGIRVTYEDIVGYALEGRPKPQEPPENEEEEGGLWHKLLWKKRHCFFQESEVSLEERKKYRLGNNFYMVGYHCPDCGKNLHMVVYPVSKEFQIETEEGAVLLSRTFTCDKCKRFYTPRPEKLLADGDIYCMDFEGDEKAYEDYLELLGKNGERISNPNYNRFVTPKRADEGEMEKVEDEEAEEAESGQTEEAEVGQAEETGGGLTDAETKKGERQKPQKAKKQRESKRLKNGQPRTLREELAAADWEDEKELEELSEKLNAGFYPEDKETQQARETVAQRLRKLRGGQDFRRQEQPGRKQPGVKREYREPERKREQEQGKTAATEQAGKPAQEQKEPAVLEHGEKPAREQKEAAAAEQADETEQKYEAKLKMLDRFSTRQMSELKRQLEQEKNLNPQKKQQYLKQVADASEQERGKQLAKRVENCQGKPYAVLKKVYDEVARENVPQEIKEPLEKKLKAQMQMQGAAEAAKLMEQMPPHMDRARYRIFADKLHSYADAVDLTPYEQRLKEGQNAAERQEIANMVNHARKTDRSDYAALADKLKQGDFLPELVLPYLEKVEEKIKKLDEAAIDELVGDVMHKDFNEAAEAYEQIREGDFLPELKTNALELLEKRLSKIKADECELLVKKLQDDLAQAGMGENPRHHFYPARKVLLKQAKPEETDVIDYALASYAAGRGMFEYPILVADTSGNRSGKEGFILTPEHFYYSTLLTSYGFPISSISQIKASTGLLNRGLYVCRNNGDKLKVPYAVETKQLPALAETLGAFVRYLQEKPLSRQVTYLAEEKHDKICCFRCGYLYQGGTVCPKCGFKNNE